MAELRGSNFMHDIKIGEIGENDLIKILEKSPKTDYVADVSQNPIFQLIDIDIIQFIKRKENGEKYTVADVENAILGHSKERDFFNSYEVKTDTRGEETRNVPYEVISHDNAGCCGETRANYIYFTLLDNATREIKERWLITTKKWRCFIRENFPSPYIKPSNFNRTGDKVWNLLCNIDEMERRKIARKV